MRHHDAAFRRLCGRPHLNSAGGRHGGEEKASVAVSEDAWPQIHAARRVVERIVETGETVYGINTGFGALVHERISSDDLAQLQVNLIRSHATAIGELMSVEAVRAMMVIRLNSLCKGILEFILIAFISWCCTSTTAFTLLSLVLGALVQAVISLRSPTLH